MCVYKVCSLSSAKFSVFSLILILECRVCEQKIPVYAVAELGWPSLLMWMKSQVAGFYDSFFTILDLSVLFHKAGRSVFTDRSDIKKNV